MSWSVCQEEGLDSAGEADRSSRRAVDLQQSFRIRPCARADGWAVELRPKNVLASPLL